MSETPGTDPSRHAVPCKDRFVHNRRCAVCHDHAQRLLRLSGGRIESATKTVGDEARSAQEGDISFEFAAGRTLHGFDAAYHVLTRRLIFRLMLWPLAIPGVRAVARSLYGWSRTHRRRYTAVPVPDDVCAFHRAQFVEVESPDLSRSACDVPTYRRSTKLFLTLLGLIHLAAFTSLYVQLDVLMGSAGMLPAEEALDAMQTRLERSAEPGDDASMFDWLGETGSAMVSRFIAHPTIFWMDPSDETLRLACVAGMAMAVLVTLGLFRRIALFFCGFLYLSFVTVGGRFFWFQWDNLLIETTFCALLLPMYSWHIVLWRFNGVSRLRPPHRAAVFLMLWLLLRLYLESGIAKILPANGGWRDLSAMSKYYDTAPLATWIGWHARNLPAWWHEWETLLTLLIELVVPMFIFASRPWRWFAFIVFQSFQVAILLTANYGLFNYLSIALGFFLLDDRAYLPLVRAWRRVRTIQIKPRRRTVFSPNPIVRSLSASILTLIAMVVVCASLIEFSLVVVSNEGYRSRARVWRDVYSRYRVVNSYHLFAGMTPERHVPRIEGLSGDGEWVAYPYRFAPSDPKDVPRFAAPHQPRFDFQMWFVTLSRAGHRQQWFTNMLDRVCDDPQFVDSVFRENPFPDGVPIRLRVLADQYEMTTPEEREESGAWWKIVGTRTLIPQWECSAGRVGR